MDDYGLKEGLMGDARRLGICLDGYNEMRNCTDKEWLVWYYMANPDWCMELGFPSLVQLKENFSDCGEQGLFVGRTFHGEKMCGLQTYAFHNCKGTIEVEMDYDKAVIPMLYFANKCRMRVVCRQDNGAHPITVPIYSFGHNDISARDGKCAKYKIYNIDVRS